MSFYLYLINEGKNKNHEILKANNALKIGWSSDINFTKFAATPWIGYDHLLMIYPAKTFS